MGKILWALVLITALALAGCSLSGKQEQPLCSAPYIEYKTGECCADENNNSICDNDEQQEQPPAVQEQEPVIMDNATSEEPAEDISIKSSCGDGICQANETCRGCVNDCSCRSDYICRPDGNCEKALTNEKFELFIGDKAGRKIDNTLNTQIGSNVDFSVWVKNRQRGSIYCNYTTFINWQEPKRGELDLYHRNETFISYSFRIDAFPQTTARSKVYWTIVQCENYTSEISYTIKYS